MLKKYFLICVVLFLFSGLFSASMPLVSSADFEDLGTTSIVKFRENFDGVMMPQLPNGWFVSSTGTGASFATTTTESDTAPNSVYSVAPPTTSSASLVSPAVLITGANSFLEFRHKYSLETTWDGGVLEISINNGEFQDIVSAGGTFVTGGYTNSLNASTNPLANRFAWSGATQNGFLQTSVRLPSNAFGQNVRFRWRLGTNESFGGSGWWIDSVTVETVLGNI